MEISSVLRELAGMWRGKLYVVGGAVRDAILGVTTYDVDLASSLTAEEVCALLEGTRFVTERHSAKLGTLGIRADGEKFEYTAFRTDSYDMRGAHAPASVEFGVTLEEDALRRDFTVNAVYYDISEDKIVDVTGGVEDMKRKLIRTVRDPREVIAEDALRIMRMVRFAASYGFDIDAETMNRATEMSGNLVNIAPERIREEFERILSADEVCGIKGAQRRGLELLKECGAVQYAVPELTEGIGVEQNKNWHRYDVYGHILSTVENAPRRIRLAALFHDIAKPVLKRETGGSKGHEIRGAEIAELRMTALKYSKAEIAEVKELVAAHMFDLKCNEPEEALRLFIQEHIGVMDKLLELKDADWIGGGTRTGSNPSADRIRALLPVMKEEGVAFSLKDLKANGKDLDGVPPEMRSRALRALMKRTATDPVARTREGALGFLKNFETVHKP